MFLLPDWLIRSAAPLAEEAIGSTPTPPLRLGVSFHRRSVSALFTLIDTRATAPTGADKWERGDNLHAKRFQTGPAQSPGTTSARFYPYYKPLRGIICIFFFFARATISSKALQTLNRAVSIQLISKGSATNQERRTFEAPLPVPGPLSPQMEPSFPV